MKICPCCGYEYDDRKYRGCPSCDTMMEDPPRFGFGRFGGFGRRFSPRFGFGFFPFGEEEEEDIF